MRRHRLLPITLVSFLLLCLTVICANASWFIQDKSEKDGSASNIAPDTSDYFTTGGHVFDAGKTDATPALNSDGVTVLGGTTADYTITWVGCALNTIDSQTKKPIEIWKETASGDTSTLEGVVAGTHYYQIVENATGQIISNRHAVTIQKRPVTVSTPAAKAGFVGMNSTWDYSVYGISSNGGTYAFDGSNVSFQYSYTPTLQDYYKTGYKTSTTAHTKDSTFPASEDVTYTGKVIDKYPSLSGSTQYGNFTVDYANNYYIPADLTYTATCNVLPTTYTTQNTTTYWATLTEAIKNTTSGTIYPMQQVNGYSVKTTAATPKGTYYEHLITENCEIKPGVTLTLLYGTDPATILTYTNGTISELVYTARNSTHLKNEVTICADIKLTNYGSIVIAGTVHGGNGGSRVNSAVGGSHAQIKMMDRAGLICKTAPNASTGGDLTCYGFITEASNKNQSYVDVINGNTTVVFSMSEHRGGTHFFEIYSGGMKGTPFNRFWIETISSRLTVHHGAYLLGHVMLYANSQNNPSDIALIGNSNRYLIQTKDGTQITAKYNHDYNGVTVTNRTTELEIKGDADFNSMAISIDTGIPLVGVVSLSTSTVFFPLSGYYHVTLSPNEDKKGNP
ncbi:MAG: hypothetical protein IJF33_00240, partial [Clostridia bacterium]|nr:hypothetical protein [Clostridia bacterium]